MGSSGEAFSPSRVPRRPFGAPPTPPPLPRINSDRTLGWSSSPAPWRMATPPPNPVPWIVRRAVPIGGRGPRPRKTATPLVLRCLGAGDEPPQPRALGRELTLEHRHTLGGGGWEALLVSGGEAGAWGVLLGLPLAVAEALLPLLHPADRAVLRAELAVARRRRWGRRAGTTRAAERRAEQEQERSRSRSGAGPSGGQGGQQQAGAKEEVEEEEEEEREEEEHPEPECFWCVPGGCCCEK